uniref:thioredoxin-like 1-1, chloroplastic n=1 Tax=Erigeron canadensis TaxID=72917 RepID=UPI001CB9D3D8|nr:thioredoxin-like 1-1, chloroplastic [Erigeron canadensis]
MAEIIGKFSSNYCKFSPYNNNNNNNGNGNLSCYMLKKKVLPVMMIKMPVIRASKLTRSDSEMFGRRLNVVGGQTRSQRIQAVSSVKMGIGIGKPVRWWEKDLKPNMKEITSAEDLVDSLLTAGDKLVIVDFFSPGCGGCRALHPKICQMAEMNPNVQFLHINYEEHKSMCYSLNVHVLPFFRFYRGAQGRLCSFSCTNATIKKFKEALAKHAPDRSSLGPPKGLEEKELLALGSNKDLSFTYAPNPNQTQKIAPAPAHESVPQPSLPLPRPLKKPVSAA